MSGTEVAEVARQMQPQIKVLFTTGYAKVQTWNGDPSYEAKHLLRKPYRGAELATKIREALDDD